MERSFFEIVAEMLEVAKNGAKKTHIMYSCDLSYRMTKNFLTYLVEAGLLRKGNSFYTTKKGLQFLQAYQTLNSFEHAHANLEKNEGTAKETEERDGE